MLELQSQVHFEVEREFRAVARGCNQLFDQLRNLVGQLGKEITRARAKAQVQKMRELTDLGRAHANMIRASAVSSADIGALVSGWAAVGEQVGRTAQDMLPAGDNVLSTEASRILNEIVKLVNESIPEKQREIDASQKRTSALTTALREKIGSVENHLQGASQAAVVADNRLSKPAEVITARATAYDLTGRAVKDLTGLRSIVAPNCTSKCSEALSIIDDLVLLLEGTQQWIKEPEKVMAFNASRGESGIAGQALARQNQTHYAHPVVAGGLNNVLDRHCPPGSSLRVAFCTTCVLLPVKAWAWWRSPSSDQLVNALESGVRRANRTLSCAEARRLAEDIVNSRLI
jgi:hypothetical protein